MVVLLLQLLLSLNLCSALPHPIPSRALQVGVERYGDTLPLTGSGSAVYAVHGIDSARSYEIKVSYPASMPARFSLTLLTSSSSSSSRSINRRLLDTEKLIFAAEDETEVYVRVSVQPTGVIPKSVAREQQRSIIVFNILCERVFLSGIPQQAVRIGALALAAIALSFTIAALLPRSPFKRFMFDGNRFTCTHRSFH